MCDAMTAPTTATAAAAAAPVPGAALMAETTLPAGTNLSVGQIPQAATNPPVPLLKLLMPLAMVGVIGLMVTLMLLSGGGLQPMMLMFPIMMLVSVFAMVNPGEAADVDETRSTFLRGLDLVQQLARRAAFAQKVAALRQHPAPLQLVYLVGTPQLWAAAELAPVRIALGDVAPDHPVTVADSGPVEDLDPVCAVAVRTALNTHNVVHGAPITFAVDHFPLVAVIGEAEAAADFARALVAQLVTMHSPEQVAVAGLGPAWGWLKWLPHSTSLARLSMAGAKLKVLVVDGSVPVDWAVVSRETFDVLLVTLPAELCAAEAAGSAVVELVELCFAEGAVFEVHGETLKIRTSSGLQEIGVADRLAPLPAERLARAMSGLGARGHTAVQSDWDTFSVLGLPPVYQLTAADLWQQQPSNADRLTAPLGMTATGEPCVLDIKESAQGGSGPHGLCIGATGSGKSELLRTFVLALALKHHPDELNFVLVDFKGGATFLGLEKLPHTSAVITNLAEEAELVNRMQDAISGEMTRRQEQLRAAGNVPNVQAYRKLRATQPELPPLPALVIVLDEFSELLGQHPDFAELFVAVGRLGRSLEVHLLLASQRLEEGKLRGLDSHLSYRIGLKTFSAAESRQVLGVADAYNLPAKPGAGFLKTAADEVQRFQASYVSGPVVEQLAVPPAGAAGGVRLFRGHEETALEQPAAPTVTRQETVLELAVAKMVEAGQARGLAAHKIWLDPLPEELPLAEVLAADPLDPEAPLTVKLGLIDRPFLQKQEPLEVDFRGSNGHWAICGGPQTGKTMALTTLAVALGARFAPGKIRLYGIDTTGQGLKFLARLPHTAGVAGRGEPERIGRIVDEVLQLIDQPEPTHTFLLVDGWQGIISEYEDLVEHFARIATDGLAARVHLVLTTPRWSLVRPQIRDVIGGRLELKLTEAMDSLINRKAATAVPNKPGRGLTPTGEPMLLATSSTQDIAHVQRLWETQQIPAVAPLKELPATLSRSELPAATKTAIPFAVGGRNLTPISWNPAECSHFVCFGSQGSGKTTLLHTLLQGVASLNRAEARMVIIDFRRTLLGQLPEAMIAAYAGTSAAAESTLRDTVATLTSRLPGPQVTPAELKARSWWTGPEIYLAIDDYDLIPDGMFASLIQLVPHARDIGLHLLLTRKSGGASRAVYDRLLAELRDSAPTVVVLSTDREEGKLFGVMPGLQPPGRGAAASRGEPIGLVQTAQPTPPDGGEPHGTAS